MWVPEQTKFTAQLSLALISLNSQKSFTQFVPVVLLKHKQCCSTSEVPIKQALVSLLDTSVFRTSIAEIIIRRELGMLI